MADQKVKDKKNQTKKTATAALFLAAHTLGQQDQPFFGKQCMYLVSPVRELRQRLLMHKSKQKKQWYEKGPLTYRQTHTQGGCTSVHTNEVQREEIPGDGDALAKVMLESVTLS